MQAEHTADRPGGTVMCSDDRISICLELPSSVFLVVVNANYEVDIVTIGSEISTRQNLKATGSLSTAAKMLSAYM